ncbi:MAG: ABC transporter substrate-binding protein [Desulfobacterales bacterium]|nr:ABC transporter substrate-binding protein [Desulfobacterales bacterium]
MKRPVVFLFISFVLYLGTALGEPVPKKGGELFIAQNADAVSLDPARITESESGKISGNIYEGLVGYHDDSTEVQPKLATSWETSRDGKKWIFHLRKGVRFHDGTPFNAEAVAFSFLRQIDKKHAYYREYSPYSDFTFKYVKQVNVVDEYTIKIILDKAYAPFLYNLAMSAATPIISPTAFKKWGDDFEKHPVGTGPFKFKEWIPNNRVVLVANTDYWGRTPFLNKLIFRPITNISTRFEEFLRGRIHVMDGIAPKDIPKIKQMPGGKLFVQPGLNIAYIGMNTEKKPFGQIKVRKAINYAINKRNLIKLIYKNLAIPAKNPIPPTIWGYNDNIEDYEYSTRKAKQLLKEAGFKNGFKTTLSITDISRPYLPQPKKIARAIKSNLSAVGIKAKIVSYDWRTYLRKLQNGEHDMCLSGWLGDNGDPDNFLYVLLDQDNLIKPKSTNFAFFKYQRLHDILIKAQQITNKQKRIKLYRKAQEIIHDQSPWVPLAHAQKIAAFQKKVHGVVFHPTGIILFHRAWIE